MTIKQQGGVFGRNPSFNNVSIDTLTVDSSASVNGPLDCDGFTSNGQSNFVGTLGTVFVSSDGAFLNFTRNSGNYIRTTGASSSLFINTALKNRLGILNTGDIYLYKDDGVTVGATWDASAGNLAFASGSGIDFSATSGTGTSELFDDYEEGTWTPVISVGSTGTATANYTKIGNMVTVTCKFVFATVGVGAQNITWASLPFTPSLGRINGTFQLLDAGTAWYSGVAIGDSTSDIQFTTTGDVRLTNVTPFILAANDELNFTITYRAD